MKSLPSLILLLTLLASPSLIAAEHGVVLMYHRFDENAYPSTNIRMEQFESQLDYLQENGFTIWPLRKLLKAIYSGDALPDKTVALSVDDAYLSVYRKAFPLLKGRKIPLTVFVSSASVGSGENDFMSWEQMREMQRHNIDFANHTASHLHLTHRKEGESRTQWLARVRADIEEGQRHLENALGPQGQRLLAYPFGEYNRDIMELAEELGYLALGQHSGAVGPHSNRYALPRFPINEHFAALDSFALKAASLPLPVIRLTPQNPQVDNPLPPRLEVELDKGAAITGHQVGCYRGNGRQIAIENTGPHRFVVQDNHPLKPGRNRYNCTAPAGDGRFYWFSQPWFNGPDPDDPAY